MGESLASDLSSPPSATDTPATSVVSKSSKSKKRSAGQVESSPNRPKRARTSAGPVYTEVDEEEETVKAEVSGETTTKKGDTTPKSKKTKVASAAVKHEAEELNDPVSVEDASPRKVIKQKSKSKKVVKEEEFDEEVKDDGTTKKKVIRKRKTKEEKEAEAMHLVARTIGSKILVGAHISSAGGVQNAVPNSVHIGGNAFALFLKSQRKWANPALPEDQCTQFLSSCKEHKYDFENHKTPPIVPHGSYLVNLAHPDADRTKQAYDSFIDDLDRCRRLGIVLYNFHPGNCAASSNRSEGIAHLAKQLNKAHKDPSSGSVITLLETMAAVGGNTIGSTFEDIAEVISLVEEKDRVGVCLDTCHVFAAGYDLRSPETYASTIEKFDSVIGLKYLRAFHMNDSKAPLASGRDLHANIGTGFLGLRAFHNVVNDSRMWGLPMVLETPIDVKDDKGKEVPDKSIWAGEIKLLESLVGMNAESEEFLKIEKELQAKGTSERERVQAQVDKRGEKKERKAGAGKKGKAAGKKKGGKRGSDTEESASD